MAATNATGPARATGRGSIPWQDRIRSAAGRFWFGLLFSLQRRAPWVLEAVRPVAVRCGWRFSRYMRQSILENATHLLPDATNAERNAFGRRVLDNFYQFVCELGSDKRMPAAAFDQTIHSMVGKERYLEVRGEYTGAILLTAHLGAFETAMAVLRRHEPRVHVVFRRDESPAFERLRTAQRQRLGVIEAPVDEGIANWVRLRDALRNNEVVLLQGDRVLPGQRGRAMPFCDGHLMMPTGPVKLALASGAPIIPVFSPRTSKGRVNVFLEEPIIVAGEDLPAAIDNAMKRVAAVIERYVCMYADQWLMIHRAWCPSHQVDGAIEE